MASAVAVHEAGHVLVGLKTGRKLLQVRVWGGAACSPIGGFVVVMSAPRESPPRDGYSVISRITRQGFPAANAPSGMSLVTTLPAPMTDFEPTFTPGQTTAPPPLVASSASGLCTGRRQRFESVP